MISQELIDELNRQLPDPMRAGFLFGCAQVGVSTDWNAVLWPEATDEDLIAQAEDMASEYTTREWKFVRPSGA